MQVGTPGHQSGDWPRSNAQRKPSIIRKREKVRDNIHVASFMLAFAQKPLCGELYNLGGGFENSCSL
jgi:hypothetical protein